MDKKKKFYLSLETFRDIFQMCPRVPGQDFDELPTDEYIVSFFKELGHTGETKDDYLINTLRFVFAKEESQIYEARLPKSMTSPEMRETKAYKTHIDYATGVTLPKKARKFMKPASPKLATFSVSPKEPTRKSKRVKRPTKKSTNAPTTGVVVRDTPVMSLSKKKEKYKEVRKKCLRDFHKTHPSGSGIVTKIAPSAVKIKPSVTNERTGVKPGVPNVTEEESTKKSKVKDKAEGDEDKGMDYTTNQLDDDVDVRLNEPVNADEGFIQKGGTDGDMINVQQGNENLGITLNQVIEDAHVTISTIAKKTEVPVTSSSHSSDLAA
nr:hypothetical protein [Tanacetum cinerariifolium]